MTPDKHIETKYGLGTIRNLSSGCKTLLNIAKHPDKVVCVEEPLYTPEDIARIRREILDTTNQELGGLVGVTREYIETGKFCAVGDVK